MLFQIQTVTSNLEYLDFFQRYTTNNFDKTKITNFNQEPKIEIGKA